MEYLALISFCCFFFASAAGLVAAIAKARIPFIILNTLGVAVWLDIIARQFLRVVEHLGGL